MMRSKRACSLCFVFGSLKSTAGQSSTPPARLRRFKGLVIPIYSARLNPKQKDLKNVMAIPATQIRRGMVILFEGQLCKVVDFRHHTPGNLRAMVQTKLRNLRTGSSFDHRFRSADTVDKAALEQHDMEYLYSDGSHHHFMNTESYEQVALSGEDLGDAAQWLAPGLKIQVEFYEGLPIGIELPPSLELTVAQTEPTMKGATVSNVNKPATLENGVTIQVPPFVNEGDRLRVDPTEGRYIERAK